MAFQSNTAPGVYTQVVDASQSTAVTSQYLPGIVGVAEKGPFDTPVQVNSLATFIQNFGASIPGNYLANTAQVLCNLTDGVTVVRVGNHYTATAQAASGTVGTNTVFTPQAKLFAPNDYVRVSQAGKATTVNGLVLNVFPNASPAYFTLVPTGGNAVALADTYTSAEVDVAEAPDASNPAEGFLASYQYTPALSDNSYALTCDGNKNSYEIQISGIGGAVKASDVISPGDLLKIVQPNRNTTREILVLEVRPDNTVFFQTSNRSDIGYQAIALQDSYVSASTTPPVIYKVLLNSSGFPVTTPNTVYITAASDGTWANSSGLSDGLVVRVAPGSASDTKQLQVYLDNVLSETIDNLNFCNSSASNWAPKVINGNSVNIRVTVNNSTEPPANSRQPWNLQVAPTLNITGLTNGFNGENASVDDFIGTLDPATETMTGLQVFADVENVDVNQVFVPGRSDTAILQELALLGQQTNIETLGDVPFGLTASEAIDWHNGNGIYSGQGRINNPYLAVYWNWFQLVDYWTGQTIWAPPTIGAARAFAYTYNNYAPWYAAAGGKRGLIPEALGVQYTRVPLSVRNAMYGNGNSVNPILLKDGSIQVYGERTMQVAESEFSVVHTVNLINYIVTNFGAIGNTYVFDPNDPTLLNQIYADFNTFLKTVQNGRGIEGYGLVCDSTNNTPATRNKRMVVVSLYVIPTETMERLFVTINVNASGATLVSSSATA